MPYRFQLVTGRVWRGSAFGGVKGRTELPGIIDDYLNGKLWVDEFVTHRRGLKEINEGFDDMHVSHAWTRVGETAPHLIVLDALHCRPDLVSGVSLTWPTFKRHMNCIRLVSQKSKVIEHVATFCTRRSLGTDSHRRVPI